MDGGMKSNLAHVKEERWEAHPLTRPVLGRNQNTQEQRRSVVIHLTEAFLGCFRVGEWDAFILWCLDEEGLVIRGSDREKVSWRERISWFFRRALWRGEEGSSSDEGGQGIRISWRLPWDAARPPVRAWWTALRLSAGRTNETSDPTTESGG